MKAPAWISREAGPTFRALAKLLADRTEPTDAVAVAFLAESIAHWRAVRKSIAAGGLVRVTEKGYRYADPLLAVALKLLAEIRRQLAALGLTPAARAKLPAPPENEPDPLADLL